MAELRPGWGVLRIANSATTGQAAQEAGQMRPSKAHISALCTLFNI